MARGHPPARADPASDCGARPTSAQTRGAQTSDGPGSADQRRDTPARRDHADGRDPRPRDQRGEITISTGQTSGHGGRRQARSRPASRARDNACDAYARDTRARALDQQRARQTKRDGERDWPLAVPSQGRVVVPYPSREHARVPPGLHSVPTRPLLRRLPVNPAQVAIRLILPVAYAYLKD